MDGCVILGVSILGDLRCLLYFCLRRVESNVENLIISMDPLNIGYLITSHDNGLQE